MAVGPSIITNSQGLSCTPPAAATEIVELARALKWNPDLIYEYVHNNIATIPIYDSLKGPLGALVDGAGTPVDQADLMVQLLLQSCYTLSSGSVQYVTGLINLTITQLTKWLGVDANCNSLQYILNLNGFGGYNYNGTCTAVTDVDIPWIWVRITIGGTNYHFDPASKKFSGSDGYKTRSTGLSNLAGALGYTQQTFINNAEAGATGVSPPLPAVTFSSQGRANERTDLAAHAKSLINYITSTIPAAQTSDIVGGAAIDLLPPYTPPSPAPTRWGRTPNLCYYMHNGTCYNNSLMQGGNPSSNISGFLTKLTVTLGSNDASGKFTQLSGNTSWSANSRDIYGHRIAIQFDTSAIPSILLDGLPQATATKAVSAGLQLTARIAVNHQHLTCASLPVPAVCTTTAALGNATNGSTVLTGLSSTSGLAVGMGVTGTAIPASTVVQNVDSQNMQVTISNAATASGSSIALTFYPLTFAGTTSSGSPIITGFIGTGGLLAGMHVSGGGVPSNSVISSVDSTSQITISQNASASSGAPIALLFSGGSNVDNVRVTPVATYTYILGTAWGGSGRGMIERHRRLLQQNQRASNGQSSSEPVLGESLAMIGYTWVAEYTRVQELLQELTGVTTMWPHAIGIIGTKAVGSSLGPYVDLPLNTLSTVQRTNHPASASVTPAESTAFFASAMLSSVLESGTIEQTQPSATATSTVKLLDQWSQGGTIYNINDPGLSGDDCSYYASTIRSQLTNYSTTPNGGDQGKIDKLAGWTGTTCITPPSSHRVIAPSNGSIAVNQWSGGGWLDVQYDATGTTVIGLGAIISGGLSGGYPASPVPPPTMNQNQASGAINQQTGAITNTPSQEASSNTSTLTVNITVAAGGSAAAHLGGGDPMDLVTGSYVYSHTDISVGSGPYPFTLPLVRTYDSGSGQAAENTSFLGNGWMHNYDISSLNDSDGFEGMGANSPISGAASIAALYAIQDVLNQQSGTGKPTDRVIIAAIAAKWLMDQMTNNVVAIAQAGSIERFVLLPDGTYNAPLGSASRLSIGQSGGYQYQSGGGATSIFNPLTVVAAGKIATWSSAGGASLAFNYNSSGQLASVLNPGTQQQLNFHYSGNQLVSVDDNTRPTARVVTYVYDGQGNLASYTDPSLKTTTFAYGTLGQLTQIFYPSHPVSPFVAMGYDTLGRPNQQADANGNVTSLYFAGTRTEVDDPAGTARVSYFTLRGKTLATIDGLGSPTINGGAGYLTSYTYDGLDRVLSITLPAGNGLAYTYDSYSNPLTITQVPATGSGLSPMTTTLTYTRPVATLPNFEEVLTSTDPLNIITKYFYDTNGNRTGIVADAFPGEFNATTSLTYDGQGHVLTQTDAVGTTTQYTYDASGNLITTVADYGADCTGTPIAHLCQTTQFGYDAFGNRIRMVDPTKLNVTTYSYDADRRLTQVTPPFPFMANITQYGYDANGRVTCVQRAGGGSAPCAGSGSNSWQTTTTSYTATGKQAAVTDPNGYTTYFGYDGADRLSRITDPAGQATIFTYDALSRTYQKLNLAIQATPLEQYGYTPNSKLATLTDGKSNMTTFTYDGLDRLSSVAYPDNSSDKEAFIYDGDSNISQYQNRAGQTTYFWYDRLNRLYRKAPPLVPTVNYTYDLAGHITSVSDTSAVITPVSGAASYTVNYTYDQLNRATQAWWLNAPVQTTPTATTVTFSHSYDRTNRRVSQTATDNTWLSYPAATASTTSYMTNSLNQYSGVGSVSPTYDGNGNLTCDGGYVYSYDTQSRLTSASSLASFGNCSSTQTLVASYAYDGLGRRKSKTVGSTTTMYIDDADNREVLEYDGTSGLVNVWYSYALGPNEVLNQMSVQAGTRATFIPDIQGSTLGRLASGQTSVTKLGNQTYGESSATGGMFRFTGQRLDNELVGSASQPSGLYYMRARMYSPTWGRFMQADPIGYAGGVNFYAYLGNDPLNLTDPSGTCGPLTPVCILAVGMALRAGVGFIVGYGAATVTGVKSSSGRLAAGGVGAAFAVGGPLLANAIGPEAGTLVAGAVRAGTTIGTSAAGGATAEVAGQFGDVTSGCPGCKSSIEPSTILQAAGIAAASSLVFGEAAVAAGIGAIGEVPGIAGAAVDVVAGSNTAAGGVIGTRLVGSGTNQSTVPPNGSGLYISPAALQLLPTK